MTKLFSSFSFQVCFLAATMSLCACGQREMILPQGEISNANRMGNTTTSNEAAAPTSNTAPASAMRFRGGPDKKNHGGGGPIIVIEDTHFKGSGGK
jgi:hypothetical protein